MRKILAVLLALAGVLPAYAITPFVIKDIQVEGAQRTEPGTIFNYLPVKVGDMLTEARAQDAIRALFKTGFFNDVRLEKKGDVLVVVVSERPSIDSIKITGTKEIPEDQLMKSLKEVGLAEGRIFNRLLLDQMEQELKRQYFSRGYYAVQVKPTVTPLERNRVAISIDVSEGNIASIQQINIVGNATFSDDELLDKFQLSPPHVFSFFTKNDQYSRQKLASDLESLRSYYQNRGFLEFNVESTQVSISPDKESIFVTINISEGKKFFFSGFKLAGKQVVAEAELRKLVAINAGDVFSRQVVTDSSKKITDLLGNEGYAFANVNPVPEIDREKQQVAFTFFIDPGPRVYVRRINFVGNTNTRDEVLRREMRQFEGALYSAQKIQRSVERLRRLGFFDEVTVDTPMVPGSPDQVDVNVTVKERDTGTMLAGIGYSDAEGVLLNASISIKNLWGSGREIGINVDNSQARQDYYLNYVNPYYTPDGISRGFNLFYSKVDASEYNTAAYNVNTAGAGVFFGIPISEARSVNLGLAYESADILVSTSSAQVAQDFVRDHGTLNDTLKGTFSWAYDTVDSPIFPTRGTLHRLSTEVGLPGAEIEYAKLSYLGAWYLPLTSSVTLKFRGELGYGDGYGGLDELPFYKNFYAGGTTSVRGYQSRSLGPRDSATGDPIGGNKRVLGNSELLFPVPGGEENRSMRFSTFVDTGMAYGADEPMDLGELRYSAGLAFNWFSPVGPMAISWAKPLNAQPEDETDRVQFTLGTSFR